LTTATAIPRAAMAAAAGRSYLPLASSTTSPGRNRERGARGARRCPPGRWSPQRPTLPASRRGRGAPWRRLCPHVDLFGGETHSSSPSSSWPELADTGSPASLPAPATVRAPPKDRARRPVLSCGLRAKLGARSKRSVAPATAAL
jgi:hypothetical protein